MIYNIIANDNGFGMGGKIVELFAFLIAILSAIVLHEVAHGYIAYMNGDMTAKFAGRLTLNPVKHFDLFGFLMLALVGFGWAKPVPVDSRNFRNYKKGMITVSLAGVVTNLIMATLSAMLLSITLLIYKNAYVTIDANAFLLYLFLFLEYVFIYSIVVNLTLMAFNILPIYPLDGFRVVETLAKPGNRYVNFMYRYGMWVLLGLLLGGNLLGMLSPWLDPLGLYINWVQNGVIGIFNKIFGLAL